MKKRVLIFHHHGAIGGAGLSLLHIIDAIDKTKYEISVVCPQNPNDMVNAIEKLGVTTIKTDGTPVIFPHYNGGIKYAFSIRTFINCIHLIKDKKNVLKIINDCNPDIVIVNSMLLSFLGKYITNPNVMKICFDRETFQKGLFGFRTRIIKNWMSNYFDELVFISKFDSDHTLPCKANKRVITDKVKIENYVFCCDNKCHNEQFNILFLGGISKLKGIHILLKSLNYVNFKNIKVNLIASKQILKKPNLIDYVFSALKLSSLSMAKTAYYHLKNKNCINVLEPTMEPEKLYMNSNLVVFPSTVAHQARPIYEAGAARVPVIVSDFKETNEFAIDSYNCLTFKPSNWKDLARKITDIIENKQLRDNLVKNNYNLTVEHHNYVTLYKEMSELLNEQSKSTGN